MAKKAYIGVGGVARKIKKGYIGIEGEVYPNSVGLLPVGSTVKINENGSPVDYLVVHQGNPNPTMYDASCDGTWVLRKDLVVFNTMGYHYNDYGASYMHNNLLNGTFLATLDTLVQNSIVQVKIPYYNRNGIQGSLATGASGLSAQVFLLSIRELGINTTTRPSSSSPVDGTALQYFESASDSKRIANYNGSAYTYWTRTPSIGSSGMMNCIMNTGQVTNNDFSATTIGARPAFVLPSTLLVSNGIVNGEQAELTRSGISHIIKKAYIGIGGVARLFWGGGEVTYYGTITPLSAARSLIGAATVGNYALFAGGSNSSDASKRSSVVDTYNQTLTKSTATGLTEAKWDLGATTVGNYALFAGGELNGKASSSVNAYNTSLTRSSPSALSVARMAMGSATVGNYALFGGGRPANNGTRLNTVDAYSTSLTRSTPSALTQIKESLYATTVGNYALFAGGDTGRAISTMVNAYNASLTRSTATPLTQGRQDFGAVSVGDYALFGGGYNYWTGAYLTIVEAYNKSLTRTTVTSLSKGRENLGTATIEEFALFCGGDNGSTAYTTVDVYDASLTRTSNLVLNRARCQLSGTTVGNYALFGGGDKSDTSYTTVDAFTV